MQLSPGYGKSDGHGKSNTETVTRQLRELILTGRLSQGEKVTETGLAALLGVSRTPVRLALAVLEQEDLVQGAPNRGFRVRRFTIDDMRESIEVRSTMEGMAARLAAENGISAEQNAALAACIEEVDVLIASRQHDEAAFRKFSDINIRFHTIIVEAAANSALMRVIERNPFRSAPLLHILPADDALGTLREAQRDHIRLVEAILAGQGTRAEFMMREHALLPLAKAGQLFEFINANAAMQVARKAG